MDHYRGMHAYAENTSGIPMPRLTMACGRSIMSIALCAMTLRSSIGRAAIEEMGACTSPACMQAHLILMRSDTWQVEQLLE